MGYAELFSQSNFSFLHGASHPEELVERAAELGYHSLALCDECSLAGVVKAHQRIKELQLPLKLIVGSLLRFEGISVVALCPNQPAYSELCRVITNARRRAEKGSYQFSQWDLNTMKHCLLLWLPRGDERDHQHLQSLLSYHRSRLAIGFRRYLRANDHHYQAHCEQLAAQHQLPITACGGVLMHHPERLPMQQVLHGIRLRSPLDKLGRKLLANQEYALRPLDKLQHIFPPTWLAESVTLAERCDFNLDSLRYQYPAELVPDGDSPDSYLRKLTYQGCEKRFPEGADEQILTLIEKELGLIAEQGYAHFFLTIHDVVQFARRQQILYQGRGSAANSVVCYCLEITSVDPRQISLLFERFISKERNEPPDIDVDFEHQRREEVVQYIYQKYGRERAALAASVRTYRFRSALREVGKALGLAEHQLDFFIKNIDRRDRHSSWQQQLSELGLSPDSPKARQLVALVEQIMGFPRHLSQHVGGYVISAGPLYHLVPIENAAMPGRTVIQWDKDDLESLGLLKVDVLALGMLTALSKCFGLLKQHYQRELSLAQLTAMQDDQAVYQMIQRADTVGLFQIESRAQMSMLPRLKPRSYYDLVIQIAIVRPGPIQGDMVHPYLKRRNGEEAISYPSEAVKEVLARTMGVPIFQEQVIKLAMVAAGFSGGEADQLRRAMASWRKSGELQKFQDKLVKGMTKRGYDKEFALQIYRQIGGFGEYGFPESHSASFAVLAYASAWLKHYYPAAYFCSLLNSHPMGFYSPSQLVQDARRHKVEVLPVCINHSDYDHLLCDHNGDKALRLGLRLVKGLSQAAAELLVAERPSDGYQNISQLRRLDIHQGELAALASADALKALSGNRYQSRWELMEPHTLPLFADLPEEQSPPPRLAKPQPLEQLKEDYAALGLSLEHHPVTLLEQHGRLGSFRRAEQLKQVEHGTLVSVVGVVTGRQSPGTAAGVTFITLEDDTGNINVVVWSATSHKQKSAFLRAKVLKVVGVLEREGDVIHVIAGRLEDYTERLGELRAESRDFH
ncbi:error-prone DNA polymerase [Aliagarivorans marinus]|uniref:error-prone DNA polymerase n=1 Tax=Aliagarivorans marinus TaxID=561965 RepID=UPI0003FAC7F7|nr:error-prone DNA polymerase [Aliagarivorans marinus]